MNPAGGLINPVVSSIAKSGDRARIGILVGVGLLSAIPLAAYQEAVGFTALADRLPASLSDGSGIAVAHIEADADPAEEAYAYAPDPALARFDGKTLTDVSGLTTAFSGHANGVGGFFYGLDNSMTPGIATVANYEAGDWLTGSQGHLRAGSGFAPRTEDRALQNHSWIVREPLEPDEAGLVVEAVWRFDFAIVRDGYLAVVGLNNGSGSAVPTGLAGAYNTLSVGRTDGAHSTGGTVRDGAGRTKPEIVAPLSTTSHAVPVVASAAALLREAASMHPEWENSIGNAAHPETLRALLTAGATKSEFPEWDRTESRPFDERFGAGELNVDQSYAILAAGERDSLETGGDPGSAMAGWDRGRIDSEARTYRLVVSPEEAVAGFSAVVTWNRRVTHSGVGDFWTDPEAMVADLRMRLEAAMLHESVLLDRSDSPVDNYEHVYRPGVLGPGTYDLVVDANTAYPDGTDYAIAWRGNRIQLYADYEAWSGVLLGAFPESERLPAADGDGDGFDNLTEYAHGSDGASAAAFPQVVLTESSGFLEVAFRRNRLDESLSATIVWSRDLSNWDRTESAVSTVSVTPVEGSESFEDVVFDVAPPGGLGDGPLFVRVEWSQGDL